MKTKSIPHLTWSDARSAWLTVASILSSCALVSTAGAANITENALAPSGNILASQLTDLGPGTQDNSRDYTDNGGPPGQTFTVASPAVLDSVTILGRGDSAGVWVNGPQPFTGTEIWGIQISSVNGDGSLSVLTTETATGFTAAANVADYLTFALANPVNLSPGVTYAWSLDFNQTTTAWFGLAHSSGDAFAAGYAFNNNSSIANPGGNTGGARYSFNGFAAPNPNNYDYVFAVQGTVVPEPGAFALMGLSVLGLLTRYRRRRA